MQYKVVVTLLEPMLGTASANPDLYREFIESKRPEPDRPNQDIDDEAETLPSVDDEMAKCMTVFHRTAHNEPFIYDYLIKGFFKNACSMLRRADDTVSKKVTAHRKQIDGLIFVTPRQIVLRLPKDGNIDYCQRPLRGQTAQGERIALAISESVPGGTVLEFTINLLSKKLEDPMYEWLEYGQLLGLGQWRNSGMGRFNAEVLKVKSEKIEK